MPRKWSGCEFLFVPGNRPGLIPKALATTTSRVCIDLEDSVPELDKANALRFAIEALEAFGPKRLGIRINPLKSRSGVTELLAITGDAKTRATIFLPKVETASEIDIACGISGRTGIDVVPLVETVRGIASVFDIASHPACIGIMFGGADLAAEIGIDIAWEPLLAARQAVVAACVRAHVAAIDMPWLKLDDNEGLAQETAKVRALGFVAKSAIHPSQLGPIQEGFLPDTASVEHARAAVKAFEEGGGNAIRFSGELLDEPVIERYRKVIGVAALNS